MVRMAIATMSSKGQIVIPAELRDNIAEGEKFIMFRKGDTIVMQPASATESKFSEEIAFAKRTRAAWKRYEEGKFKNLSKSEFLKELEKW